MEKIIIQIEMKRKKWEEKGEQIVVNRKNN